MRQAMVDATDFLEHIGPIPDRCHLSYDTKDSGRHSEPHIADWLGPQCASHDPVSKILLHRSACDVTAGAQQACSQHIHEAPPSHMHRCLHLSCLPVRSGRVKKSASGCLLMADKLQNRVTLEKLKSRSVIAGTRSFPVSDVIASAGLVKASIRLKARRGLS